jgi:hypothetical protein
VGQPISGAFVGDVVVVWLVDVERLINAAEDFVRDVVDDFVVEAADALEVDDVFWDVQLVDVFLVGVDDVFLDVQLVDVFSVEVDDVFLDVQLVDVFLVEVDDAFLDVQLVVVFGAVRFSTVGTAGHWSTVCVLYIRPC